MLLPVVLLEYYVLIWVMGRDGILLATGLVVFALCVLGHIWLYRKYKTRVMLRSSLLVSALMTSPIIAVIAIAALARALGIELAAQ